MLKKNLRSISRNITNQERDIDITGLKQTLETLSKSEEKFRLLFNKANDSIGLCKITDKGQPGSFIEVNDTASQRLGYSREELLTMTPFDITYEGDLHLEPESIQKLIENGHITFEATEVTKNGIKISVEVNLHIFNLNGIEVGLAISRDITERKHKETELQNQYDYLQRMEKSIRQRITLEEAIAKASRLFISPEGSDLNQVLKILGEAVSVNRAYIFRFRLNQSRMDNLFEWCGPGTEPQMDNLQDLDSNIFPWWMRKLEHGENIEIPDVDSLLPDAIVEKEILQAQEIRSLLVVPIFSTNGTLNGFMGFDDTEKCREWSGEDTIALRVAAEMVGVYWEHKQAEEELQETNRQLQQIIEFLPDATFVIDRDKQVIAWNRAIEEMTGVKKEDMMGKGNYAYAIPFYGIPRPILIDLVFSGNKEIEQLYSYFERRDNVLYVETPIPLLIKRKEAYMWGAATPLCDSDGNMIGAIESIRDISEQKRMEGRLQHLATHDAPTNIPNRYSLEEILKRAVAKAKRGKRSALFFIDIDNFKLINDTLGHAAGDELLISLVNVLNTNLREGDFLARFGGDEFAVLLEGISDQEAGIVAEKLRRAVYDSELDLITHVSRLNLSISIGIIMVDGTLDYQRCLSLADTALYKAKEEGRNRVVFADPDEEPIYRLTETNQLVGLIKSALQEDLFVLHFQPIVRIDDGKIIHHEVLIRLKDKDGQIIPPGRFIPVAERFGFMSQIDQWVVKSSLATMIEFPEIKLFINLSGVTLGDDTVLGIIESSIQESAIDPSRIGFEITETAAVKDISRTEQWVRRLKSLGCLFALDDFGTGFSSFTYLRILPVDYIKIDGSFVNNADKEPVHRALIQAIKTIADTLGMKTIAEFVENEDILKVLQIIGIDYGQGFYLGVAIFNIHS